MDEFGEEGFKIALRSAAGDFKARHEAVEDLLARQAFAQRLHDNERRRTGREKFAAGGVKTKTVRLPGDGVKIKGGRGNVRNHSGCRDSGRCQLKWLTFVVNQGGKGREFHSGG